MARLAPYLGLSSLTCHISVSHVEQKSQVPVLLRLLCWITTIHNSQRINIFGFRDFSVLFNVLLNHFLIVLKVTKNQTFQIQNIANVSFCLCDYLHQVFEYMCKRLLLMFVYSWLYTHSQFWDSICISYNIPCLKVYVVYFVWACSSVLSWERNRKLKTG